MDVKHISDLIKQIACDKFPKIERLEYLLHKQNCALDVVREIGIARNEKFVIDTANRFTYENIILWVHGMPFKCIDPQSGNIIPGRLDTGIYLGGTTGSGKSWTMEIMSAYSLIDNVQVKIGGRMIPLHWECMRAETICEEYAATGTLKRIKDIPVLCIQDFGAERTETVHMGNRIDSIRQLLEHRGDSSGLITHITSNYPIGKQEALTKRYGDRVVSRLMEMCNYFEIKGKDRRKQ